MSSLLGPVTDADLQRWQRKRFTLLSELIAFGEQHKLSPLTWTLGVHALSGQPTNHPDAERRAVCEAWARALGIEVCEQSGDFGRVHLRAATGDLWDRGVGVVVMADLWEDDPAD